MSDNQADVDYYEREAFKKTLVKFARSGAGLRFALFKIADTCDEEARAEDHNHSDEERKDFREIGDEVRQLAKRTYI